MIGRLKTYSRKSIQVGGCSTMKSVHLSDISWGERDERVEVGGEGLVVGLGGVGECGVRSA